MSLSAAKNASFSCFAESFPLSARFWSCFSDTPIADEMAFTTSGAAVFKLEKLDLSSLPEDIAFCSTLMVLSRFASLPEPFSSFSTSETNFTASSTGNSLLFSCTSFVTSPAMTPYSSRQSWAPCRIFCWISAWSPISRVAPRMVSLILPNSSARLASLVKEKQMPIAPSALAAKPFTSLIALFASSTELLSTLNRI